MYLYILFIIIIFIIVFQLYIKIKYPFWSTQPVYSYYHWFARNGIIANPLAVGSFCQQPLKKTKYVNIQNIVVKSDDKLTNNDWNEFLIFLRQFPMALTQGKQKSYIRSYFHGHATPCYFSFYYMPTTLYDTKTSAMIEHRKLVGVFTSRPLLLTIGAGQMTSSTPISINYMDFLHISPQYRAQQLEYELIETHEYVRGCAQGNKNVIISIFREKNGFQCLVPMTTFKIGGYLVHSLLQHCRCSSSMEEYTTSIWADSQNIHSVYNFIQEYRGRFEIFVWPELTNLMEQIKVGALLISVLFIGREIKACYFFRQYKRHSLCIASIRHSKLTNSQFLQGFLDALCADLPVVYIEEMGENCALTQGIKKCSGMRPWCEMVAAYYFYNFVWPTCAAKKVFFVA